MWNSSYRTTSECRQKTPDFQKSKLISSEWDRAKDKDKKETNDLGTGTRALGSESWRRKSFWTLRNPFTGWVREGELQNISGGMQQQVLEEQNRKFTTKIDAKQHFPAERFHAHTHMSVHLVTQKAALMSPITTAWLVIICAHALSPRPLAPPYS